MNKSLTWTLIVIVILAGAGFFIFKTPKVVVVNPSPAPLPLPLPLPSPSPLPLPPPSPARIDGFVAGHVTIGPFCPVERVDMPCKTPPEAYTSRLVIVYDSNGTTINKKGKLDTNGNYKITLSPGNYFVQIDPAGIGLGEKKPATVKSLQTTVVNFDIDTGIR